MSMQFFHNDDYNINIKINTGKVMKSRYKIGLDILCWHNFENNREPKELKITPE